MDTVATWWRLTAFGDSTVILPMAALLAAWLFARRESQRSGWLWIVMVLADGGMVAASKVLYMAWGVHPAGLDFIGLSGHTAMAFLFWPVLGTLAARQWRLPYGFGAAAGMALAAGVAVSRLGLRVHSPSEVLLGALWGAALAAAFLWQSRNAISVRRRYGWLLLLALLPPLLLARQFSFPSNRILVWTAEQLGGHGVIYTRDGVKHIRVDTR